MPKDYEVMKVLQKAQELLHNEMNGSLKICKSCCVEQPIPVIGSDRCLHSWFVPVTAGKVMAGFFEFQPDLTLMRYSSFQRHEDSLEGCPPAELWIDPKSILHRINEKMRKGEKVQEVFLTYDKVPSRLTWAVVLESPDGTTRTLHVVGNTVW